MNFIESIKTCFHKFFDFKGRARRSEYWWLVLFTTIGSLVMTTVDGLVLGYGLESTITPLATAFTLLIVIPSAAVTARRLHDVGMSGWWQLPQFSFYVVYLDALIPGFSENTFSLVMMIVGGIYSLWLLFMMIKDSQPETNKYGPNPKSPDMGEVFS